MIRLAGAGRRPDRLRSPRSGIIRAWIPAAFAALSWGLLIVVLGRAAALAGDYEGATAACRTALAVDTSRFRGAKDSFSLHWILARALLELGRGDEAAAQLELILVKVGPSRGTLTMLAQAYLQAGRPEG